MASFKDGSGREWLLTLTVGQLERVEARAAVRFDRLLDDQCAGLKALFADLVQFGKVLWVLVEKQAGTHGVSPEQFADAIWGDAIESAMVAFMDALADFYPSRQRKALQALAAKMRDVQAAAERRVDAAVKAFREADPECLLPPTPPPESSASSPPS